MQCCLENLRLEELNRVGSAGYVIDRSQISLGAEGLLWEILFEVKIGQVYKVEKSFGEPFFGCPVLKV